MGAPRPSGPSHRRIANIESPRIIGQLVTATLLGSAAMNAVLAALMFWYDEPAAGGPTRRRLRTASSL